jgi:hypothetical protein
LLGDQPAPLAAGLTRGALYLDRPRNYPFELLASTFTVQLGLTPAAWVDAWERAELVKVAATFAHRDSEEIGNGVLAIERAALVSPAAAATAQAEAARELADRVRASHIHVRVRDTRFDDLYWPVAGIRLLEEVGRTGDAHPLVRSGLFGTGTRRAELVLQAVNLRLAQLGDSVAWQGATARFGAIPDYIWLDTGETPERDS